MTSSNTALLVLEDGTVFRGRAWGSRGRTLGEIVFSTGMTGYQETLTDPSYHRQIVVMTAPHIGNTGVNDEDPESSRIWVAGFVVRDGARRASNWRSRRELEDELLAQGIVGIADVDTRAVTRHIRERGAMRAGIFSGDALPAGALYLAEEAITSLVRIVAESPAMSGQALAAQVSTEETYVVEPLGEFEGADPLARVVAVDLGIKSRTPYHLAARGARVYVVPSTVSFADIESLNPDGVFFSNGPGDPSTADREVGVLRAVLDAGIPYFGICFGHQLFGRALGYGTYKLNYGHRGINQPVKDLETGRVEITAASTSRCSTAPPDASRSPRTITASPWTPPWVRILWRLLTPAATGVSRSHTSGSTTVSWRAFEPSTFPPFLSNSTPRRRPAPTTGSCSSTALCRS